MTANKLLIIEDDVALNNELSALLRIHHYDIQQAFDGEQGLLSAVQNDYDLILLDVLMPKRDGFSVLKMLRQSKQTPVIMLTACGAEEERIKGLSRGADDYIPKPFNTKELELRIDAILRRCGSQLDPHEAQFVVESQGLRLNKREQSLSYNAEEISLTPIQFNVLWVLANNAGEVLTKQELYQLVLDREFSPYDRSLDMHLSRVRKKLVACGMPPERLKTVHGAGYRFL